MLRKDYALLRLTVMNYTRLHAAALACHDLPVATMACTHLRALSALSRALVQQIRQVTPRRSSPLPPRPKPVVPASQLLPPLFWPDGTASA